MHQVGAETNANAGQTIVQTRLDDPRQPVAAVVMSGNGVDLTSETENPGSECDAVAKEIKELCHV